MRRNNLLVQAIRVCVGLLLVSSATAVEMPGLYEAQVPVVDRETQTFRGATQDALAEVIVRVSGDSRAIESVDVMSALSKPDRYLLQFDYQKLPTPDLTPDESRHGLVGLAPTVPESQPTLLLNLQFDEKGINQLLRRAGLPIWASNRPEVLLWLGAEEAGQRQVVSPSSAEELSNMLMKESARRGLPLSMPLYDLEDQSLVSMGDIWGLFTERLIAASGRYPATGILMAKLYQNREGAWVGSWVLNIDDQSEWFDAKGVSKEEVVAQAVDWATDHLAAKYAVLASADDSDTVTLQISGVSQLEAYAKVSEYLDNVVAIRHVQVKQVQGGDLVFQVYLESDKEQLQQALKLDGQLQAVESEAVLPAVNVSPEGVVHNGGLQGGILPPVLPSVPALYYRWNG